MSLERSGAAVTPLDDDERYLKRLEARARIMAKMPGLKASIANKPDAVLAIAVSLEQYGFSLTVPGINGAFDWIQDRAEPTAQFCQAIARQNGYHISPRIRTRELAVAHVTCPRDPHFESFEVEFNESMASDAHRLDAWVEQWHDPQRQSGKGWLETYVVRINGKPMTWQGDLQVPVPEPLPEWVTRQLESNRVKRFDGWWNWRTDMMWKSAAKRAARLACSHILLGGSDFEQSPVSYEGPVRGSSGAAGRDFIDADPIPDEPEYGPGEEPF